MDRNNLLIIVTIIVDPIINPTARSQNGTLAPKLFVGGGALPEALYGEFIKLTGLDAKLVVIPTASNSDIEIEKIKSVEKRDESILNIIESNRVKGQLITLLPTIASPALLHKLDGFLSNTSTKTYAFNALSTWPNPSASAMLLNLYL